MRASRFRLIAVGTLIFMGSVFAQAKTIDDSKSPCRPYRLACVQAGFKLNDTTKGNRLIGDCMLKLVNNQSATSTAANGRTATVLAGANAKACEATIHHRKK